MAASEEIKKYLDLLKEDKAKSVKIKRDAFLYLDPNPKKDFAQCSSCASLREDGTKCALFGPRIKIKKDASCGLYTPGTDQQTTGYSEPAVTKKEAGYVERQVRCENCSWYNGKGGCELYYELTKAKPDWFSLDEKVDPKGCCNAQTPKS